MASICPHFLRGVCRYGPLCRQSHDTSNSTSSSSLATTSPMPFVPIRAPKQSPCKFFLEGRCNKGTACFFNHPDTSLRSVQHSSRQQLPTTKDALMPSPGHSQASFLQEPCKYFLKGMCKNGSLCTFRHPDMTHIIERSLLSPADSVTNFPSIPCKYYRQGKCSKGGECMYLHTQEARKDHNIQSSITIKTQPDPHTIKQNVLLDEKPANTSLSPVPTSNRTLEDRADTPPPSTSHARMIQHCEVHFGVGASVTQITTPFESCHVILSNLPKSPDMLNLTQPLDGLEKFTVFETSAMANLQFTDCDQAAKAVRYLDDHPYAHSRLAARLDLRGAVTVESVSGTLLSRRVKLSWFSPTLVAWANYSNKNHAQKMVERINAKPFNGRSLSASIREPGHSLTRGTKKWISSSNATVKIKGLPLETELIHLERFTHCDSVTIGEPTYAKERGIEGLRQLLSQYGRLESFDMLPTDKNKPKFTAFAQFSSSDAAAKVAKEMHNTKQEFLGNNIVWGEQIHSIKYKIPWAQFMMVKNELDHLQTKHDVSKLLYYDPGQGGMKLVCIRIYGSDPKLLGRLKVDVEQVLRGEPFTSGGKDVWDEYFETEEGARFIKELNSQSTIFVKCDTRTRTLCLYGDRGHAKRLITQDLERRHVLSLGKEKIRGLLMGGLRMLMDEIGPDKVVLDVIALTLTIRGDDEDIRKVRYAIATMDDSGAAQRSASLEGLCPVCFCDLSDPFGLPCGHSYCLTCLKHLLRSHSQASTFSLIKCVAEIQKEGATSSSSCNAYMPYPTIRDILLPAEEATLLEASFLSHIHERPKEFHYCPTPNCNVIYKRSNDENDNGTVLQCPKCLARICVNCNIEFHEGLTCAEHIDNVSGGLEALQKWKEANGVKSCPKCDADLEKIDGCDHITCGVCKTHMCWVCMKTFSDGPQVYEHMRRLHGSIGLDHLLLI